MILLDGTDAEKVGKAVILGRHVLANFGGNELWQDSGLIPIEPCPKLGDISERYECSMYELHKLGWHSFQNLCLTITREVLGQSVESFLDSNDGGRDGAFTGSWNPTGNEALKGRFVIQCKFTSKKDHSLRSSDISDEVDKAQRLAKQGRCDCYILMTNASVSGNTAVQNNANLTDLR